MCADEERLLRTPPNEEEGFHQSLSTHGSDSRAQHKAQQCYQREIHATRTKILFSVHARSQTEDEFLVLRIVISHPQNRRFLLTNSLVSAVALRF